MASFNPLDASHPISVDTANPHKAGLCIPGQRGQTWSAGESVAATVVSKHRIQNVKLS